MTRIFPICLFLFFLAGCATEEPRSDGIDSLKHDSLNGDTARTDSTNKDSTLSISDSVNGNAHTSDCRILNKIIPKLENDAQIQKDLEALRNCSVDSFDMLYVVPNLFPGYVSRYQLQGIDTITYGDFLQHMRDFEMTDAEAYHQIHVQVKRLDSLRATTFDVKKLYAMKSVLGQLGFDQTEWDMFEGFVKTYPVPSKKYTWGQMLDDFEKFSKNQ
jgi:hypothetical protein